MRLTACCALLLCGSGNQEDFKRWTPDQAGPTGGPQGSQGPDEQTEAEAAAQGLGSRVPRQRVGPVRCQQL